MEEHVVKIIKIERVTHNVKRFTLEKPAGYAFIPGQATEVSVNKHGWEDKKQPFTFTCLNEKPYLEFTIKIYPQHNGVTNQLGMLNPGDSLLIRDVWGTINYRGPGVFIAGGAGVTPFIAILRQLYKDGSIRGNQLIFSNHTREDIIMEDEFRAILGMDFLPTLTGESIVGYENRKIDAQFLKEKIRDFTQNFYICGPGKFVDDIVKILSDLGADPEVVVTEK
jgi:ferredoxin-NADP reductase